MNKKSLNFERLEYILMLLLLVFSGNPIIASIEKYALLICSMIILIIYYKVIKRDFYTRFFIIASALVLL